MYHASMHDTYMTQISKIPLDKKTEIKILQNLELILAKLGKREEMGDFLFSLLTRTEKLMLAKRLAIVILLKEGISQTTISSVLKVTRATVSRIQLIDEARGSGFTAAFKKHLHEENTKEIRESLLKIAGYSIRAASGRT